MIEPKLGADDILAAVNRMIYHDSTTQAINMIFPGLAEEKDDAIRLAMMERALKGIVSAACVVYGKAVLETFEQFNDKLEGLEEDLREAVQVAYNRGAVEWAELNYPGWKDQLKANSVVPRTGTA